ncbi:MAG: dihydrodipicolinate synthase family protein [Aggregatilineales bacterium]
MVEQLAGVFNIMATPFDELREVDYSSLKTLVEFQLDNGVDGLTVLGVLGEAAKLTVSERHAVMETVIQVVNGRVPVIVGTSHQDLQTCIALSQTALAAGATGVMVAPPRFEQPTDAAVIAFYEQVAACVDGVFVVQDFPPVTNVILSPALLAELAAHLPKVRHLKLEDPPLMQKIGDLRRRTGQFAIFGGLGGMFFLEELERGAVGTMTGFAFSEILVAVYRAFKAADRARAEMIFDRYLPLIRFENQPVINLPIRKELLRKRGAIASAFLREPFMPLDTDTLGEIDRILLRVGIADPTQKLVL